MSNSDRRAAIKKMRDLGINETHVQIIVGLLETSFQKGVEIGMQIGQKQAGL